jgi:hypothetical protein
MPYNKSACKNLKLKDWQKTMLEAGLSLVIFSFYFHVPISYPRNIVASYNMV